VVTLFLLVCVGLAQTTLFSQDDPENKLHLTVEYLQDNDEVLSIESAVKSEYVSASNKHCYELENKVVWYKVAIRNSSDSAQELFLHNNKAYLSKQVQLFELMDVGETISHYYDLFDEDIGKQLKGGAIVYPFTIAAHANKTLYIKNKSLAHQCIDLEIHGEESSTQALINKNFYSNIILTILLTMAIYNLVFSFFIKRKEFAYYAAYLINAAIGLSYMYGSIFHNFHIYGEQKYWLNITAILVSVFLVLFVQAVLETKRTHHFIQGLLNSVIAVSIIDFLIAVFIDLSLGMELVNIVFIYSFVVLFYVAIKLYQEQHELVKLLSLAYISYIIGISITLLAFIGYIPFNEYTFHASGIGILIEALFFSYLIHHRIGLLQKQVANLTDTQSLLLKIANIDELTGVINRRAFNESATNMFEVAQRRGNKLSLLMLDLDFFKDVNDQYGHHVGDETLIHVTKIISQLIREEDLFGRVGGEEFCIVLPNTVGTEAEIVAEKIRKNVEEKELQVDNIRFYQTLSIGVTEVSTGDSSVFDLQKRADKLLYLAKSAGRNKVMLG